jgi:hypothetical protein
MLFFSHQPIWGMVIAIVSAIVRVPEVRTVT